MRRPLEIASGIGVLFNALLSSAAVFKLILDFQQRSQKVPIISLVSLGVTSVVILLSFAGAFILLSWANKPR